MSPAVGNADHSHNVHNSSNPPNTNLPSSIPSSPTPTPLSPSHSHFPLSPIRSHLSRQKSPVRNDGYDNIPIPLPSSHNDLERRLTTDPDVERQMAIEDVDIGPPPEGGFEAWACISGSFFVLFCIFGFTTSFGQLQSYYLEHQLAQYSKSEVAWIASVQTFLTFFGSIVFGRYFDSHGARLLVISGTILSVGALIGLAFCKEYWQFMLGHAAFGFSGSLLYSTASAVAGHWFMRRRSTAVGIVVAGAGLSGVIYPIALKRLIDELSFRDALLIIAGMNACLMIPSIFTLKARLPPRTPPPLRNLLGPWKELRYTCLVIGSGLILSNWLTPYYDAPILASSNHVSASIQSYSIAMLQAGSFIGRVFAGILADRFGVWNMYVTSCLFSTVFLLAFWTGYPLPSGVVVVGLVSYGISSGGWITLVAASCGAISPTREYGMRLGMLWSLGSVGTLVGPVISGALIGVNDGRFTYAAIFCAATTFIGVLVATGPVWLEVLKNKLFRRRRPDEAVNTEKESRS